MLNKNLSILFFVAMAIVAVSTVGCGQSAEEKTQTVTEASHEDGHGHDGKHDGWWCVEHAIPEDECSMCNSKVAADFQAKGDWCEDHNRADSQCFICHPEKAEKFAALYEANFGEQPPAAIE